MKRGYWMSLVGVALVVGLVLLVAPPDALANPCGPNQCYHLGYCFPLGSPECGGSCGGGCKTLYQGHELINNCAYNGGSCRCFCPLPGQIIYNYCY